MRNLAAAGHRAREAVADAAFLMLQVAVVAVPAAVLLGVAGAGVWWMADRFGPWAWAIAVVVPTVWALTLRWLAKPEPSRGQAQPVAGSRCEPSAQVAVPGQSVRSWCEGTYGRSRERAHDRLDHPDDAALDDLLITGASISTFMLGIVTGMLAITPLQVLGALQLAHVAHWN